MQHLTTFDSYFFFVLLAFYIAAGPIQASLKKKEAKNRSAILFFALISILISVLALINSIIIIKRDPTFGTLAFAVCAYVWPCFISLYVLRDFSLVRRFFRG